MFRRQNLGAGFAALVVAGSLLAGSAFAQQPGPSHGPGRLPALLVQRLAVVLDLSQDQTNQIRSILQKRMESNRPLFQQAREARQALQQAVQNGQTDAQTLKALADR